MIVMVKDDQHYGQKKETKLATASEGHCVTAQEEEESCSSIKERERETHLEKES